MNIFKSIPISILLFTASQSGAKNKEQVVFSDSVAVCHTSSIPSRFATLKKDSISNIVGEDKSEMVKIEGGTFEMGSNNFQGAQPLHQVTVNSFYMDVHEVTNAQFEAFVKATGYVTVAERPLDPKDFPGADPALLVPGSAVFSAPKQV